MYIFAKRIFMLKRVIEMKLYVLLLVVFITSGISTQAREKGETKKADSIYTMSVEIDSLKYIPLTVFDNGNFIVKTDPSSGVLLLSFHEQFQNKLLANEESQIAYVSFVPTVNEGQTRDNNPVDPRESNSKFSLETIFGSPNKVDWTGKLLILINNSSGLVNKGCSINLYRGMLIK